MKSAFDYIHKFVFKNFLALPLLWLLFDILKTTPSLHDSCIVLLTLVIKYYYDSSNSSSKKDETISKALDQAQQLPAVIPASEK